MVRRVSIPFILLSLLFAISQSSCGSTAATFLPDGSLPDDIGQFLPDSGWHPGDSGSADGSIWDGGSTGEDGSTDLSQGDSGLTDLGLLDGALLSDGGGDAALTDASATDGGKTGCTDTKDCKAGVCDKGSGACVACLEYTDCQDGYDCSGQKCAALVNPGLDGSFEFGTASFDLKLPDGLFGTTITLTIYLPKGTGPFPVIVFHHGFQLSPSDYVSYGNHMASWGFIVVMPAMPGSIITPTTHTKLKEYVIDILDWIATDNSKSDGTLKGSADLSRIGLSGHSMGGKISLLVSTEDSRVKAAFVVDPVDATGSPLPQNPDDYPSVTPELMPKIGIPLGLLGETVNGTCSGFMCQACAPADDNFQQYYKNAVSPAIQIEMVGAFHMSFIENPDCGLTCSVCPKGTDSPSTTRMLTRKYMTAFYMSELKGVKAYKAFLTGSPMKVEVDSGLVKWEKKNGY